jgi:hypothetical protein
MGLTMARIDFLARETEAWLSATKAFIDTMSQAVRDAEARQIEALRQKAREEGWDSNDYQAERDMLEGEIRDWLAKLSAYSAVVLIHSLAETQLMAYCRRLRQARALNLDVTDIKGHGIQAARTYMTKVAKLDMAGDQGWKQLAYVQDLRNIIVHRRGQQGASREQQEVVEHLMERYPEDISLSDDPDPATKEVLVEFRLCARFLDQVGEFFQGLCRAAGFQERGFTS